MGKQLTEKARRLLSEPNFGFLATAMEDGWPHVSPVWIDASGERVLVNTAAGRIKERNVRRDPRVALSVASRENPYEKVDIRGVVVEIIDGEPAERHIDAMAAKYLGEETYPFRAPDERRVILEIEPVAVKDYDG